MFQVEFTKQAVKDLKLLARDYIGKINEKLKILAHDPYNNSLNIKKLKGVESVYRLRIGEYRIVYEIIENKLVIQIIRIKTRGNIYG